MLPKQTDSLLLGALRNDPVCLLLPTMVLRTQI